MSLNLLLLFALLGCSSWKQKDFEKDLHKTPEVTEAQVEVKDESLIQKFEVKEVESKPEPIPEVKKSIPKKTSPPKKATAPVVEVKKVEKPQAPSVPQVKALPEDYPAELVEIDKKAKKVWDVYQPNHTANQKTFLDIHYLGMTVGKIMVTNMGRKEMNGKEVWHFHARFKSAPFYSNIYELDDTVDTFVQTENFMSLKYSLVQRESKQDIDDLQLHDRDQMKSFWFYKRKKTDDKKVKNKEGSRYIPKFVTDPFSLVFLYQGLPLKDKDVYQIPLVNKDKLLIMKSFVEGREVIETELGKRSAIRIHATTQYSGDTLKSGDMYFWMSDDAERSLLKAQAKIKIGSVTADIVKK